MLKRILNAAILFVLIAFTTYLAFYYAPLEKSMGVIQKIFYLHVSSAFSSFVALGICCYANLMYVFKRQSKWDWLGVAAAEVGVVFILVVLITGPIWAHPVWGIWWTWDARLTSTLLLWLIYLSYLVLRRFARGGDAALLSSALAIFGFVDVGFVYMANRWFRTQHPAPVLAGGSDSGLDPRMAHALLINFLAFLAYGAMVVWIRYRMERARQALDQAHALAAVQEGGRR